MKILGIIPARMASQRFPGKPLVALYDKPMIQHVYQRAIQSRLVCDWVIATPDREIQLAAEGFGARAIITSDTHESGTDRCIEVILNSKVKYDAVINVQGDEPLIEPKQIDLLATNIKDTQIATLYRNSTELESIQNPNTVKITTDKSGLALYFSRAAIPYDRNKTSTTKYKLHVGMYAYTVEALINIHKLNPSELEQTEKLEQLRWLENELKIKCIETHHENHGVDTPQDLEKIKVLLKTHG